MELIATSFNYWAAAAVVMIGIYGIIGKRNLIKKIIGLAIFQTGIILFYVSVGAKTDGNIPILDHHHDHHHEEVHRHEVPAAPEVEEDKANPHSAIPNPQSQIDPTKYDNPLPHVLMLTAIVVGVATLGLALALAQRIYQAFGTLEEDEILAQLEQQSEHD